MILTSPLLLLGLLTLPLLAAIYWFRSRSRRVVVSSLMLWIDQRRARQGGQMFQRMQAPLSFFLELLILALLVLAAAGPAIVKKEFARPLVVVLDDSYSMLAQDGASKRQPPRRQAEKAIIGALASDNYSAQFILAGAELQFLGQSLHAPEEARERLEAWQCQSPASDQQRGIAMAAEVGGSSARILVLSDQPPPMKIEGGQVEWWSFGSKLPNMAFTQAVRSWTSDGQRVLIEVSNLSDSPGSATLTLEGGNLSAPKTTALELSAGAARQFLLTLPSESPELRATLNSDALEIDNRVLLLPESARPQRVMVDVAEAGLRGAIERVLDATGMAVKVADRPELVISDRAGDTAGDAWRVEILGGKETSAYTGPFVIDRGHALAQGLSLEGAIWSGLGETRLKGQPVVTAGNVPLMTDSEDTSGRHCLQMNFAAEASNLADLPDWPILFANLLRWRRGALPGVTAANVRLGQTVPVTLASDVKQVEVAAPDGTALKLDAHGRRVDVPAQRVGLYTIHAPEESHRFACNAVSRDESDLSGAKTGRWGDWNISPVHQDRQTSIRWSFILAAMAVMAGHLAATSRQRVK
jgi:hypothetical protein